MRRAAAKQAIAIATLMAGVCAPAVSARTEQTPGAPQASPQASAAVCSVGGAVTSGAQPLPGVAIVARVGREARGEAGNGAGSEEVSAATTDLDGSFTLRLPARIAARLLAAVPSPSPASAASAAASTADSPTAATPAAAMPAAAAPAAISPASADRAALRITLIADLPGFAAVEREITFDAACHARADIALQLASRAPAPAPTSTASTASGHATSAQASASPAPGSGAGAAPGAAVPEGQTQTAGPTSFKAPPMARRGAGAGAGAAAGGAAGARGSGSAGRGGNREGFRGVDAVANQGALQRATQEGGDDGEAQAAAILPPGFSTEAAGGGETMTLFGQSGRIDQSAALRDRLDARFGPEGEPPPAAGGGPGFGGGPGGPGGFAGGLGGGGLGGDGGFGGGFGGGPGMMLAGRAFGGRGANRVRGSAYYQVGGSAFDANPYRLTGNDVSTAGYLKQRFGATAGGPLKLPGTALNGDKTSFFLNYTANHSSTPFDSYATVPTEAVRGGDFSSLDRPLLDPLTGAPFAGNIIPSSRIDPAARALLGLVPLPNLPGERQNFHYATTTEGNQDNIGLRIVHRFGATSPGPQRGAARGAGGGRGRNGPASGNVVLNVSLNVQRSTSTVPNAFPTLGGSRESFGWNLPVSLSFVARGFVNNINARYNRNRAESQNLFAFTRDVAGDAGIEGVSTDPFDWGAPNLSFSTLSSLRDLSQARTVNSTFEISDTVVRTFKRQHTVRFGGLYRQIDLDSRTAASARGSFVFTGLYTGDPADARGAGRPADGADFADFLLGAAQQANVAFGPGRLRFSGRAVSLFAQDDWRMSGKLTLNAGVRYEYVSPLSEAENHLVSLDVAPDLSSVALVQPGQPGPFSGALPATLVRPDRNNIAPRIGLAWQARQGLIVRAGYGINYTTNGYASIAQQLATQPPFAVTATSLGTGTTPVPLTDPLALAGSAGGSGGAITNTYAIDPNYRLGLAQVWNLDLQRSLPGGFIVGGGYTGTRGSDLDLLRAPNRGPDGLLSPDVPPYILQTSGATSIMHSATARVRRRMAHGVAGGMTYTWAKAIDNASSIGGGGGGVVAQNDRDLAAERGLSSFDRRHQFIADMIVELPFGRGKRWLDRDGLLAEVLGGWQVSANGSITSGTPYTARVLGSVGDVAGGTSGTRRADVTGQPVSLSNPTIQQFFNTAAFTVPAPGTFGNAGRNTIEGPGSQNLDMSLQKSFTLSGSQNLSVRLQANNVLNRAQFAAIDTVVNSPTFGQVVAMQPMRQMQLILRYRF